MSIRSHWCHGVLAIALCFCVVPSVSAEQADETFHRVPMNELRIEQGELPRMLGDFRFSMMGAQIFWPRVVLDSPGEAYLLRTGERRQPRAVTANTVLVVRAGGGGDVKGRLYLPHLASRDQEQQEVRFTVTADEDATPSDEDTARRAFYRGMHQHYTALLQRDVSGAAWFRHRQRAAAEALGEAGGEVGDQPLARGWARRRQSDNDLYSMFTGGRAVSENLQLDRLRPSTPTRWRS